MQEQEEESRWAEDVESKAPKRGIIGSIMGAFGGGGGKAKVKKATTSSNSYVP
jgi:hypothetical protein